ncbi:hypothetical protein RQP46_002840 [Phenoliferia psychrophenolica]
MPSNVMAAVAPLAPSPWRERVVPSPQRPPSLRTDVFPVKSKLGPDAPADSPSSRASSLDLASSLRVNLRIPFDEQDPFAPASVVHQPRSARVPTADVLPPEMLDLLAHDPPKRSSKSRQPRHVRLPSEEVLLESPPTSASSAPPSSGFLQKRLTALKGTLGRKSSSLSIMTADQLFTADLPGSNVFPSKPQLDRDTAIAPTSIPSPDGPRRISISSELGDTPRSWVAYNASYSKGEIDIENPPRPPLAPSSSRFPSPNFAPRTPHPSTPFDEQNYPAPRPSNERVRQRLLARIDLFGRRVEFPSTQGADSEFSTPSSTATADSDVSYPRRSHSLDFPLPLPSSSSLSPLQFNTLQLTLPSTPPRSPHPSRSRSILNDAALLQILGRCRALFGSSIAIVSVLQAEQQMFLASEGMPAEVESLPRDATLCAHTVLNGRAGLVVPDTNDDWRFKKSVLSVVLGTRFYAGVPIFLPDGPGRHGDSSIAIGTLAIMDPRPRRIFTARERSQLHMLATEAALEIDSWISQRSFVPAPTTPLSVYALSTFTASQLPPISTTYPQSNGPLNDWQSSLQPSPFPPFPSSSYLPRSRTPPLIVTSLASSLPLSPPDTPPGSLKLPSSPPLHRWSTAPESPDPIVEEGDPIGTPTSTLFTFPPTSTNQSRASQNPTRPPRRPVAASKALPPTPIATEDSASPVPTTSSSSEEGYGTTEVLHTQCPVLAPIDLGFPALDSDDVDSDATPLPLVLSPPSTLLLNVFTLSTRTLASGLSLSLVYLLALPLSPTSSSPPTVLALTHTSTYPPSFDVALHLRALRNDEGGLLYRRSNEVEDEGVGRGYEVGIILPVLEMGDVGIVLAGFSVEREREFGEKEADGFGSVARQVGRCIVKAGASKEGAGRRRK